MDGVTTFDRHAAEYDRWFDENGQTYQAEVSALRKLVPATGFGIEIGVGTGRFSTPFGIHIGVEPASSMARIASSRAISVCQALGERLPFGDSQFDFALLVTVVCFVQDVARLLHEVGRVIKTGGKLVIGFIDKNSPLGQLYESRKDAHKFYKDAHFFSVPEIVAQIQVGFGELEFCQTIIGIPGDNAAASRVREGYGEGAFIAVAAVKSTTESEV